eukprot:TRINITY_DN2580_c0_g1_i4.p1 TRINITY_DN2580_c0_g1~~TRINITY_DN2580_c0_g1_i4.p1  ORF type:complete len:204 (-),score=33.52 TRINITY_DN2580_c0_g1_i4:381-992(-)
MEEVAARAANFLRGAPSSQPHHKIWMAGGIEFEGPNMEFWSRAAFRTVWFSYRRDFPPIEGPQRLTTDAGWGCTLRSAQMMFSQCLLTTLLGTGWKLGDNKLPAGVTSTICEVIKWFADTPDSPYSIQNLCKAGNFILGKNGTDWYSPSHAALAMQQLVAIHKPCADTTVQVFVDNTIYVDQLPSFCSTVSEAGPHNFTSDAL